MELWSLPRRCVQQPYSCRLFRSRSWGQWKSFTCPAAQLRVLVRSGQLHPGGKGSGRSWRMSYPCITVGTRTSMDKDKHGQVNLVICCKCTLVHPQKGGVCHVWWEVSKGTIRISNSNIWATGPALFHLTHGSRSRRKGERRNPEGNLTVFTGLINLWLCVQQVCPTPARQKYLCCPCDISGGKRQPGPQKWGSVWKCGFQKGILDVVGEKKILNTKMEGGKREVLA